MVKVTFVQPDGVRKEVDADAGQALKDAALAGGVEGIIGMCGGYANCGTCHVYVAEGWRDRLPPIEEPEEMMLEGVMAERLPESRLSCQIIAAEELDGLELVVAPVQA